MDNNKEKKYKKFNDLVHTLVESFSFGLKTKKGVKITIHSKLNDTTLSVKTIKILNKFNIYTVSDLSKENLISISKIPNITPTTIDDLLDLLIDAGSIKNDTPRLRDLGLQPILQRTLYKKGLYFQNDLENINLKDFISNENCQTSVLDDLINFLHSNNYSFVQKQDSENLISKSELSSAAKSVLYRSGLFYNEDFENVDFTKIFSTYNCGPAAINDILSYITENKINCIQYKPDYHRLNEFNLSYEMLSLLYKNHIYYFEDFAQIKISDIRHLIGISIKLADYIIDFAFAHNFDNFISYKNKHRINELEFSTPMISALYKIGVYFTDDNININEVLAANPNIAPKTIFSIKKYIEESNNSEIQDFKFESDTSHKKIKWDEYQVALLINTYLQISQNKLTKQEGKTFLSNILRSQAIKEGKSIDKYYRNENGIDMCLEHIRYIYEKNESGLKNVSNLEKKMAELEMNQPEEFQDILSQALKIYGISDKKTETNSVTKTYLLQEDRIEKSKELTTKEEEQILSNIEIKNCPFSLRVTNCLLRNNITTLYDLKQTSEADLLGIKNFGQNSLEEIKEFFLKCENDKDFWQYILTTNQLPSNIEFDNAEVNEELRTSQDQYTSEPTILTTNMPDAYFESILNIEGLSNKTHEIFKLNNIRKIGQLIQYSLESLFFEAPEYKEMLNNIMLNDDCIVDAKYNFFDDDIRIITNYLRSKGIESIPIKISFEDNKKLMLYTLEEIQQNGWTNIIFALLDKSFELLKPNEKEVLFNRNGIYCEPKTLEEIGLILGVTRERVRQIESKAIGKIKKFLISSGYIDVINSMTTILLEDVGSIYKIRNIDGMKNYLKLINKINNFNFIIDEDFWWLSLKENWSKEIREQLFNILERDNKLIGSKNLFKDYLCEILKQHLNTNTEFQKENFNSILEDFMQDFIHNFLIRVDNEDNYKVARNKIRSNSGKIKTDNRNEEIIALFAKMYPNGVHLPIDKDTLLKTNLKPLLDSIPYKMSIRTLSDGILKNSSDVILWDKGLYIHVNNINIKWSVVDDVINEVLSEFDRGLGHFSIKKIYDKRNEEMQFAGIPNPDALIGLITYKNNPRIGHRKLEVFDTFDDIPDDLSKTEIIENYLKAKGDWVSTKDMQKHFCDEIGWEDYQIEQYVGNSIYAKKDTKLGFIHIKTLIAKLNKQKLQELLELLYNQTDFSKEPIKLETIRRSSFNKTWIEILGCNVTGNFMSDFIDSLAIKNLPLIFYQGSAYPESYESEDLVAKCNINEILNLYNLKAADKVYSEFKHFDKDTLIKIINSDIKITTVLFGKSYEGICNYFYTHNIQNLGVLLFFPYNSIEFKKKFSNQMIKKIVGKIYSWVESFELKQDKNSVTPSITNIFWS